MEQQTQEWYQARKNRVTASIAGAALGLSPWMSVEDAIRTVTGENPFKGNAATAYGTAHETMAKRQLEMEHGVDYFSDIGFVVHPDHDWLGASPDGHSSQHNEGLEIKCPYAIRHDPEPVFKSIAVHPHYYAQMQVQMACTNTTRTCFYQWTQNGDMLEWVDFSPEWWAENLPKLEAFYKKCRARMAEDNDLLVRDFKNAKAEADAAKERLDAAKNALIVAADGESRKFDDISVALVERKGSVDYAKLIKDHAADVDLEQYRKESTSYWKVG